MAPISVPVAYEVGTIVTHPKKPEWGPGRVEEVRLSRLAIYFPRRPRAAGEPATVTIDTRYVSVPVALDQSLAIPDSPAQGKQPRASRTRTGRPRAANATPDFEGAVATFREELRQGFGDAAYLRDERGYQWAAHELWISTLGEGRAESLVGARDYDELRKRTSAVEGGTNLLSVFERAAFRDALRDDAAGRRYFDALLELLAGSAVEASALESYFRAVESLPAQPGKRRPSTWTAATILPFLAVPDRFMFLKPQAAKQFALRLAFDLDYRPEINADTYLRLLEMSETVLAKLRPLGARDFIDVQSFFSLVWQRGR